MTWNIGTRSLGTLCRYADSSRLLRKTLPAASGQTTGGRRSLVGALLGAVAFAVLVLGMPQAHAQQSSEITGTVTDQTGAIVVNATVTVRAIATGAVRTTKTNGSGIFDFSGLDIGNYNLAVTAPGFSAYRKNGIVMNVADTLREDVPLQTGAATETITVEANALQVQSATNEISTLITSKQIDQLATDGRNVIALTSLGAGVSSTNPSFNGVTAQGSSFNLSFNGMRPDHNNWLIDGGEVYDRGSGGKLDVLPSPDVLAEFNILQSNYPPDYGISSGGTVSMVLKSGTKSFHGGAWEFIRNDALDAYPYFSKQSTPVQAKPELRLNIFGGAIGGPVWIPHLYNQHKDKTFFFWSEEWRRYIAGANPTLQNTIPGADFPVAGSPLTYVLTQAEVAQQANPATAKHCPNGAASDVCVPVTTDPKYAAPGTGLYAKDGLTAGAPFPNNTIPANLMDPNAVLFLGTGAIPKPNSGSDAPQDQYIASPKQPTYVREDVVRVDHYFNEKYHLLGSWIHDAMSQTIIPTQWSGDSYSTVGDVFANPSWAAVINLTQTLSPTLLNETALNVNGNTISVTPTGIYAQPAGWNAGSLFTGNNALNRLPQIGFSGGPINTTYTAIYWPWHNSFLDYQIRDDLTKVLGRNTIKVGFSYMRMDKNQQLQADTEGDYSFGGGSFTQNSYLNLLTGFASSYDQLQAQRTDHYINNTYSFYGNDDWRATPRLTLNLGFRYDILPHNYEKNNQLGNFNPASYTAGNAQAPSASTGYLNPAGPGFATVNGSSFYLNGINLAGQGGTPRGLVKNDYGTFQPRVGFAYDVAGDGKTVIRGGFGLFYERVQGNDTYDIDTTPPFSYQPTLNNVYFSAPTVSAINGSTAAAPVGPAGLTSLAAHYPNPGTIQFSLGIQRQIVPSVIFSAGYVGTNGWDQNDRREINDLPLSSPVQQRQAVATSAAVGVYTPNANLYRPYLGYANIAQDENEVNFSYNSLQTALRMENKHGLSLQVSYTWSHEIDIQSGDLTSFTLSGSNGALSNPFNPGYDRGSGNFDRRNILNFNYIYVAPWYQHGGDFLEHEFLGGWTLAGTTVAESGTPQNVYYNGPDVLGVGGNTTNRPNITGKISYPKTQKAWFNTAAFTAPIAPWAAGAPAGDTGFGDAGKDSVVGPGLFNWNISIYKDFPLTSHEGPFLEFRAESYNTFNHTEFNGVDTGSTDSNFGQLTGTLDPRTLQFGLKIKF